MPRRFCLIGRKSKCKVSEYDANLHKKILNLGKTTNYRRESIMCKKKHIVQKNNIYK